MGKASENRLRLKDRIKRGGMLAVPGAHDPVSAMLVERAGFEAVYVGSYATAAARLGMPDVGLVTMEEMVAHAKAVADAVSLPVLADAENGWNAAPNVWRTIRSFEQAGVCGVHVEDHAFGKHAPVPQVVASLDEMLHKVRACVEAREDPNFLIIARTDVIWAHDDLEEGVRRMNAFTDAGADVVMASGIGPVRLGEVRDRIKGKVLITDTPGSSMTDEERAGADIVLYYGYTLLAAYSGVQAALSALKATGTADGVPGVRDKIGEFEALMGYEAFVDRARRFGMA